MRRIGTQVVVNTLLVANINKYVAEDTGVTPFVHGYQHTALQHVLQQSHGFQADRFTTCVWSGNKQDALVACQDNVQRHYFLVMLGQRHLQKRVHSLKPVDNLLVLK